MARYRIKKSKIWDNSYSSQPESLERADTSLRIRLGLLDPDDPLNDPEALSDYIADRVDPTLFMHDMRRLVSIVLQEQILLEINNV